MSESRAQNAHHDELYAYDEEFRDSISTVDSKGKRIWVYPKKPSGHYHRLRIAVAILLLSLFFAGPFLTVGGKPFLLLNLLAREFVVFGQIFWPQDFVILALMLMTFFVFVITFTVTFGRIWCGWMCPQTLFMEMVFRKIEYWIEGDANDQRKLNAQAWTSSKAFKKVVKQTSFVLVSLLIAHTVMAYLVGPARVRELIVSNPLDNLGGFVGLMAFTGIFYGVFAYFREQACTVVCPYGRLQGVLLVPDSIVVAYDWLRGEPRGKLKKNETAPKGDCIDCKLCVHACPTGIDIRNGTQLECVNCTACIDACDDVMVKVGKPKGLIRFASYNSIKNGTKKLFTARVIGYAAVLLTLLGFLGFTLFSRTHVETTMLKVPGTLYQKVGVDSISNLYNIEFVNKTHDELPLELKIESPQGAVLFRPDNKPIRLPGGTMSKMVCFIKIPVTQMTRASLTVSVGVYSQGALLETVKVKFIGPIPSKRSQP